MVWEGGSRHGGGVGVRPSSVKRVCPDGHVRTQDTGHTMDTDT